MTPTLRQIFGHIFGGEPDPFKAERHPGLELIAIETCPRCNGGGSICRDVACQPCDGTGKIKLYAPIETAELSLDEVGA